MHLCKRCNPAVSVRDQPVGPLLLRLSEDETTIGTTALRLTGTNAARLLNYYIKTTDYKFLWFIA